MSFEISSADFASIVRSLRSDKQAGRGSDKRRTPRVGLSGRVTIIPCGANADRHAVTAMVRDLSTTGIGLAHSTPVKAGEQMIVRFSATHNEPAKAILCLITHTVTVGERLFTTGAKFLKDIETVPATPGKPDRPKKS
jgi:PilZ domain